MTSNSTNGLTCFNPKTMNQQNNKLVYIYMCVCVCHNMKIPIISIVTIFTQCYIRQ
jgi:hypothetical protein